MLQCGTMYNTNQHRRSLITFLLKYFPILSYHSKQSPITLLVDGLFPPDNVLRAYFQSRDPLSIKHKEQEPRNESPTEARERIKKEIEAEDARLSKLSGCEFATEEDDHFRSKLEFSNFVKGAPSSKSKKLEQFPTVVDLIADILWEHGDTRAQSRRRDEDAHTVGLGVRRISELLWTEYEIDVSPSTVWRYGTSKRQRTVRHGGRYGYLKTQKVGVRNSQLHKPHCRGNYLAANVRGMKEFLTSCHNKKMKVCFAGIDDMSQTPVLADAIDHRSSHASHRGCTLDGDTHNNYDHTFGFFDNEGRSMKVKTTGIVFCHFDENDNTVDTSKDKYGRDHLPRPRTKEMYVFNRDNHFEHGDPTMSHWLDIESAFDRAFPEASDQPEIFGIISDNGSGYDPVCPRNQHYAKLFMDRHPGIKAMCLMSFAAGESARNFEIERAWAAFKKALIGQQLGANCLDGILRGANGTLRGPENNMERKAAPTLMLI